MIRKFINHTVELSLLSPAVDATYVDEVSPATAPVQVSCRCRDVTAFQSISLAVQMVSLANGAQCEIFVFWSLLKIIFRKIPTPKHFLKIDHF